jgi:hypothetical protein
MVSDVIISQAWNGEDLSGFRASDYPEVVLAAYRCWAHWYVIDIYDLSDFNPLIEYKLALDKFQLLICFQLEAQLASWVASSQWSVPSLRRLARTQMRHGSCLNAIRIWATSTGALMKMGLSKPG